MSLMKDGYEDRTPMSRALPLAISQKRDESKGVRNETRGRMAELEPGQEMEGSGGKGFKTIFYGQYGGTGGKWKGKDGKRGM
jgi:hypothetical protein